MVRVKAVTAFVPLEVKHLTPGQYHAYALRLKNLLGDNIRVFDDYPFENCWLAELHADRLPPSQPVPADRYESPLHMVKSNIVQHQRTSWARAAAAEDPYTDVWVWLDYAVLKQGAFTGKLVTEESIAWLFTKLAGEEIDDIPFPGIWNKGPIDLYGDNWRFCGSLHIWPAEYLDRIDLAYKAECLRFLQNVQAVPNDLPIWAYTEQNNPELPFRWYRANHDATQFTNYPGALK